MAMMAGMEAAKFAGRHNAGLQKFAAATALAALGGGLGFVHSMRGIVQTDVSISGGNGTLVSVFEMPAKECHGGFESKVAGAKAEINPKIFGVPTTMKASETFNSRVTNEVCNTGIVQGQRIIDANTGHVTVTIPEESLTTTVYRTDPADPNAFISDNGIARAYMKHFSNLIKTLPGGVDAKGQDQLQNKLRGWAELGAYATATIACGEKAWPTLMPIYKQQIVLSEIDRANSYDKSTVRTAADFTVNMPKTIKLDNQYVGKLDKIEDELESNGVNITRVDPNTLKCEASKSLQAGTS